MDTLLFTLTFFGSAVLIMSVGVMFKRKPIQGSCGGIANLMGSCDICDKKSDCVDKIKKVAECATVAECSTSACSTIECSTKDSI